MKSAQLNYLLLSLSFFIFFACNDDDTFVPLENNQPINRITSVRMTFAGGNNVDTFEVFLPEPNDMQDSISETIHLAEGFVYLIGTQFFNESASHDEKLRRDATDYLVCFQPSSDEWDFASYFTL